MKNTEQITNTLEISDFTDNYIKDIKSILSQAQRHSYRAVNSVMIQAYWLVGYRIVEEEQHGKKRAGYGEKIIENLSKALNSESGFEMSVAHLWNCRQFYTVFPSKEILYTLCRELSWSHLRLIMRLDTEAERTYYIEEAKAGNWSVRELERNIRTDMFHRVVQNQISDASKTLPAKQKTQGQIKDPYILEFLGLKPEEKYSEKKLESAIISHLEKFLLELGKGFSFVARQMHIKTETQDFYIDLVFYNYILKCFVLIDLKRGSLKHQDVGQMDMYVRMYDDLKRTEGDNPTIGIVLCSETSKDIARYSILHDSDNLFAAKYMPLMPTEEELRHEIEQQKELYRLQQDNK